SRQFDRSRGSTRNVRVYTMSGPKLHEIWPTTSIGRSSYLRGRIGWQGLKAAEFIDEGPFLVTGTDFFGGRINWDTCYHVSEERFAEAAYIHLRDGDLLVTKDGSIGKVAHVENCPPKAVLNSGVFLLRSRDGLYDHRYMFYVLQSDLFRRFLENNLAGSTIQHLYQYIFERFTFATPDQKEQSGIAEVLTTVDRAIELTAALIRKKRRIRVGLMLDLLSRGIDEHGNLRSEETHQFKDSPLGRIPVEWEVRDLQSLLANVYPSMRSGPFGSALLKEEFVDSGVPLLGIDNVFPERFVPEFKRFVSKKKAFQLQRYRVRPRDLMITIMGTVGRCCVVPDNIGEALSSKHVWTVSLNRALYSPYLACLQINYSPWVRNHFAQDEQGGIMASVRSETLRTTRLPVPSLPEMSRIEGVLRAIADDLWQNERLMGKLA